MSWRCSLQPERVRHAPRRAEQAALPSARALFVSLPAETCAAAFRCFVPSSNPSVSDGWTLFFISKQKELLPRITASHSASLMMDYGGRSMKAAAWRLVPGLSNRSRQEAFQFGRGALEFPILLVSPKRRGFSLETGGWRAGRVVPSLGGGAGGVRSPESCPGGAYADDAATFSCSHECPAELWSSTPPCVIYLSSTFT